MSNTIDTKLATYFNLADPNLVKDLINRDKPENRVDDSHYQKVVTLTKARYAKFQQIWQDKRKRTGHFQGVIASFCNSDRVLFYVKFYVDDEVEYTGTLSTMKPCELQFTSWNYPNLFNDDD